MISHSRSAEYPIGILKSHGVYGLTVTHFETSGKVSRQVLVCQGTDSMQKFCSFVMLKLGSAQVTIPVEQHGEGSAASDSEEDFDKGRQHSTLPHKAGFQPFKAKVLNVDDEGEGEPPLSCSLFCP